MKTLTILTMLALAITLAFPGAVANEPNQAQSGSGSDCLDYNVLYDTPVRSPLVDTITVEADTGYEISYQGGFAVYIDFFDADGNSVGYSDNVASGTVPTGAVTGVVCVADLAGYPVYPAPLATWTYQDGF